MYCKPVAADRCEKGGFSRITGEMSEVRPSLLVKKISDLTLTAGEKVDPEIEEQRNELSLNMNKDRKEKTDEIAGGEMAEANRDVRERSAVVKEKCDMTFYLHQLQEKKGLEMECYVINDMSDKSSYILYRDKYNELANHLAFMVSKGSSEKEGFCFDLTYSSIHSLIFDIDAKGPNINRDTLLEYFDSVLLNVLKTHFAAVLKKITVILAMRKDYSGGLHVHLPEVLLSHDDYVFLCSQLKSKCTWENLGMTCNFDCPASFFLVGSGKPHAEIYVPVRLLHLDIAKDVVEHIDLDKPNDFKELNKRQVHNEETFFNRLTSLKDEEEFNEELLKLMMPVVNCSLYKLSFPTHIRPYKEDDDVDEQEQCIVARFTHVINNRRYRISKEHQMKVVHNEKDLQKCFKYLNENAHALSAFKSTNRVLRTWYKRFKRTCKDSGIFQRFNHALKLHCPNLKETSLPLERLLRYEMGYFSVPVYNALCNILKKRYSPDITAERLSKYAPYKLPDYTVNNTGNLTLNTIIYCGLKSGIKRNMYNRHHNINQVVEGIIQNFQSFLSYVTTTEELEEFILWIQRLIFPVIKYADRIYGWNPYKEQWHFILDAEKEEILHTIIKIIWYEIRCNESHCYWANLISRVNTKTIVDFIIRELNESNEIDLTNVLEFNETNVPEYYILDNNELYSNYLKKELNESF